MPGGILTLRDVCDGARAVALSQIGKREDPIGSNSGPEVDLYLDSVGLPPGNSWCAAFAYWCYRRAAAILYTKNPCPRSGSVLTIWDQIDERFKSAIPRRGSLYFVDHGHHKGHMGFVIEDPVDGKVQDVSGNTNPEGAREGYAVWQHSFRLTDPVVHGGKLLGFVDFAAFDTPDTLAA